MAVVDDLTHTTSLLTPFGPEARYIIVGSNGETLSGAGSLNLHATTERARTLGGVVRIRTGRDEHGDVWILEGNDTV